MEFLNVYLKIQVWSTAYCEIMWKCNE